MQKSLYLVLFVAFFTSRCTTLEFEKPIPFKAVSIDKCPEMLVGQFMEQKENAEPQLLHEIVSFESLKPQELLIFNAKEFNSEDVKNFPTYEINNNLLIEHIKVNVNGNETIKDSIIAAAHLRTKTGYRTERQLIYRIDFSTKTITQYPEREDNDTEVKTGTFDMRQKGDTYYLNVKGLVTEDNWYVVMFTPTVELLRVNMLSQFSSDHEKDVNVIMPLTKIDDNTYLAKPTEAQLNAFLKSPEAGEVSIYKRLKH